MSDSSKISGKSDKKSQEQPNISSGDWSAFRPDQNRDSPIDLHSGVPQASDIKPRPTITMGKYRLEECLGRGGMGEVWKAKDNFGHQVAVKLLRAGALASDQQLLRFRKEAKAMSKLQHRNICRIHEVGESIGLGGPSLFISMDYLEGVILSDLLEYSAITNMTTLPNSITKRMKNSSDVSSLVKELKARQQSKAPGTQLTSTIPGEKTKGSPIPVQQSLALVLKICDGIQYAHEHGVFHRDIKPGNVLIREDGEPVILDFGLAKIRNNEEDPIEKSLSQSGDVFGTIEYMAPEQARSSKEIDERSDLYSIAALLYQMLAGQKHFVSSGNLLQDIQTLNEHEPKRIKSHVNTIDSDLELIVMKALRLDPNERFASVHQFADDLRRYLNGEPIHAKKTTAFYWAWKKAAKHKSQVAFSTAIFVLISCFSAYFYIDYQKNWGEWIHVYSAEFNKSSSPNSKVKYYDRFLKKESSPFVPAQGGVLMRHGEWMWIKGLNAPGNVRVVVKLKTPASPQAFELCLNANPKIMPFWYFSPAAYVFQFGGYDGTLDFVSFNRQPRVPDWSKGVSSQIKPSKRFTLVFSRIDDQLTMKVNRMTVIQETDLLPLVGHEFSSIGMRAFSDSMIVESIEVYRLGLPEKTSPLISGDVLVSLGYVGDAVSHFKELAHDHRFTPLGEKAMAKAYFITASLYQSISPEEKQIQELFEHDYPNSEFLSKILESRSLKAWKDGEFEFALQELKRIVTIDPPSLLARTLVTNLPDSINPALLKQLFPYLKGIDGIENLDLKRRNLGEISSLKGLKFKKLNLNENLLEDISSLAGMPLRSLSLAQNKNLSDIRALQNMRELEELDLSSTQIKSVTLLRESPLKEISLANTLITSLNQIPNWNLTRLGLDHCQIQSLKGINRFPLERLSIQDCGINSFEALRGMKINQLNAGNNPVIDLSPLASLPLKSLELNSSPIANLEPLAKLKLNDLQISNTQVNSLEALKNQPIKDLFINHTRIQDLSPLRTMPKLKRLWASYCNLHSVEDLHGILFTRLTIGGNPLGTLGPRGSLHSEVISAFRCGLTEVKAIENTEITDLSVSYNQISDLNSFKTCTKLKRLDIAVNGIRDLKPLKSCNFESLHLGFNPISDLKPLQGMMLKELCIQGTNVSDISTIVHMPLERLDMDLAPVASIQPFLWDAPEDFRFYNQIIPDTEIKQAIFNWASNPKYKINIVRAKQYLWLRHTNKDSLFESGTAYKSHRYLLIQTAAKWGEASRMAQQMGGYLASITDENEIQFADSLCNKKSFWVGLYCKNKKRNWVNGESYTLSKYDASSNDLNGFGFMAAGELNFHDIDDQRDYLVEWDKRP